MAMCSALDFAVQSESFHCMEVILKASSLSKPATSPKSPSTQPLAKVDEAGMPATRITHGYLGDEPRDLKPRESPAVATLVNRLDLEITSRQEVSLFLSS